MFADNLVRLTDYLYNHLVIMTITTTHVVDIFLKLTFDDSIHHLDVRSNYSYIKSFRCNDIEEIHIKGRIEITTRSKNNHTSEALRFDSVTYQQCGKRLSLSKILGVLVLFEYICTNSKDLAVEGWNYPASPIINTTDRLFHMMIPLFHLFEIFNDYRKVKRGK